MQAVHEADDVAPALVEYCPDAHSRHAILLSAPYPEEYLPGLQFTQSELFETKKVPGPQYEQVDEPPVEKRPAMHV